MRLTQFTDFGMRMLMRMAGMPDQPCSTAQLAEELQLSRNHLAKIIQHLAQAGIVTTRRGGGGGVMLARPPSALRLGMLIEVLEDRQPLVECFGDRNRCALLGACSLRARLRQAEAAFLKELDRATLADIALPQAALPGMLSSGSS